MLVTSSDVECALRTAIPALHRCTPSTPARKFSGTDHRCTRGRYSIAAAHLGALLEATGTTLPRTAPAAAHLRRPRLWLARTLPTSPYGSATPTRTGSSACSRKRSAASLHEQGPTCALARTSETQRGHISCPLLSSEPIRRSRGDDPRALSSCDDASVLQRPTQPSQDPTTTRRSAQER